MLQLGIALGLILAMFLGVGLHFGARLFTKDANVINLIGVSIPVSSICEKFTSPLKN